MTLRLTLTVAAALADFELAPPPEVPVTTRATLWQRSQPERLVKQARGRAAGASRRRAPDVPAAEQQEIPECRGEDRG